ncbi:GTP-binding protein [Methanocella sp. CWC-04]|uniref:GTP-binding protein n=1 Tax=Methanooceanicella nereidis TaxID=2052831 RepID=A0AAP2RDB2_9EURY|nr:NOG1 family protein [Methanocella sp. CWC-04]MCD1295383.1 GTP-binding protein [Methanocella sp. CWC-04]
MIFERMGTILTADELIDKAFSRATRAGKGKIVATGHTDKRELEESMVLTAGNILTDNLHNAVKDWPSLDRMNDFYKELTDILVGIEKLKMSLGSLEWASAKSKELSRKYVGIMRREEDPVKIRKQAFGRMASVVYDVDKDLRFLNDARNILRKLPDVKDEPTIVVAGYPNVGKSSFVASVTGARPQIAQYPFTTKNVTIGHFTSRKIRYQVIDTPGLLDRPLEERNDIEKQAISALRHIGDVLLFIVDPSENCGYTIEEQYRLLEEVKNFVKMPVLIVANKIDVKPVDEKVSADMKMSTLNGEGVKEVKSRLVEMIQGVKVKSKAQVEEAPPAGEVYILPPSRKKK